MSRNISFYLTQAQFRARTKTVTRRFGWTFLKVGDILNAVEKGQGLKKGEKMVKMGQIRVVSLQWEFVNKMLRSRQYGRKECIREGFPDKTPEQFVALLLNANRGMTEEDLVHRIEFEYIEEEKQDA